MNPGIYFDLDRAAYEAIPGFNQTVLKKWMELGFVPGDFLWWREHKDEEKPSDAVVLGSALDCLMLDAERFKIAYALAPHVDRRTTKGKAEWLEFCQQSQGKAILTADQGNTAMFMASELMTAPASRDIFKTCKKAVLIADLFGYPCKGEIDLWDGRTEHIWDLKQLKDVSPSGFARAFFEYGYEIQATMYLLLAQALGVDKSVFNFVCVKNTAPYSVQVYSFSPNCDPDHHELFIDSETRIEIALMELDGRMKSDNWANNQDWQLIEIPQWRLNRIRTSGVAV